MNTVSCLLTAIAPALKSLSAFNIAKCKNLFYSFGRVSMPKRKWTPLNWDEVRARAQRSRETGVPIKYVCNFCFKVENNQTSRQRHKCGAIDGRLKHWVTMMNDLEGKWLAFIKRDGALPCTWWSYRRWPSPTSSAPLSSHGTHCIVYAD